MSVAPSQMPSTHKPSSRPSTLPVTNVVMAVPCRVGTPLLSDSAPGSLRCLDRGPSANKGPSDADPAINRPASFLRHWNPGREQRRKGWMSCLRQGLPRHLGNRGQSKSPGVAPRARVAVFA